MALVGTKAVLELDLVANKGDRALLLVKPAEVAELRFEHAVGPTHAELRQALNRVIAIHAC